jgi:hypothetical protein
LTLLFLTLHGANVYPLLKGEYSLRIIMVFPY